MISSASGENIAMGLYKDSLTVELATDDWAESSGHYANMVSSRYNAVGIACVKAGSIYCWVQIFSTSGVGPLLIGTFGRVGLKP